MVEYGPSMLKTLGFNIQYWREMEREGGGEREGVSKEGREGGREREREHYLEAYTGIHRGAGRRDS